MERAFSRRLFTDNKATDYVNFGFIDYNDTSGNISLTSGQWETIPNNGQGSFSNSQFRPKDVNELMDSSTGALDFTSLSLGDIALVRNDFTITPTQNNGGVEFRYVLGDINNQYTLETRLGRMDNGSGVPYRFSLNTHKIYMGDLNTKDNPVVLQVKSSVPAVLNNAGSVITVLGLKS